MKEQILELRAQGKTYNEIVEILGCSKGTVSYHCGEGQKEKSTKRRRKSRVENPLSKKMDNFKTKAFRSKTTDFQRGSTLDFTYDEVLQKVLDNPYCYLTGRKIEIENTKSYHFDHIIPISKGGGSALDNLGLTCKDANQAKHALSVDEFLVLCKEVLEHNGYEVKKK